MTDGLWCGNCQTRLDLAAHDAEVAAKAWDEGATRRTNDSFMRQNLEETLAKNPYRALIERNGDE